LQFVEWNRDERSHHPHEGDLLAVALFARVDADRFHGFARRGSVGRDLLAQGRREAFVLGIARHAVDDDRDDVGAPPQGLEVADLLVDVPALGRIGGADHDEELRFGERRQGLFLERRARLQFLVAVTDRPQVVRHRSRHGGAPHQIGVDANLAERAVEPLAPCLVTMAVAQEGAVLEKSRIRHALFPG
jgi:hypothetical protein